MLVVQNRNCIGRLFLLAVTLVFSLTIGTTANAQDSWDPPTADNPTDSVADGNPAFGDQLRAALNQQLDAKRGADLPRLSRQRVAAYAGTMGNVLIGLPVEAELARVGNKQGLAEVVYNSKYDLQVEIATVYGKGVRIVVVINDPNAPTSYTYPLDIPEGVKVVAKEGIGNAILVSTDTNNNEIVVGYIDKPWAYDANGSTVPVTQIITENSITLTVQHHDAIYPIYADPTYYSIQCDHGYSFSSSASDYLRTNGVCPNINFYDYAEFWPVGSTSGMGVHRNVEQNGQCNVIADSVYGVYDFHIACRSHDYCYELVRQNYYYVTKTLCDTLFYEDLRISCEHMWNDFWDIIHRQVCYLWANIVYEAVAWGGNP